jgi:dTDP-4-amino-4,6-dideoxygalactose transaminase
MAAILADIQPGDEVIMPSFTFVSTANAFVLRGGVPVFIDIKEDTLCINEANIEKAITDKTKAIVPVHYAGVPCSMDEIINIAHKHKLLVIEDAAQAFLSKYKDKYLGTIGQLGCLSFHETKNVISGEGGALLINESRFVERSETIWEKGTNRSKFLKGEVDKYTWIDIGSSFLPSELIGAFLYAQLEEAEKINANRRRIFYRYYEMLRSLEEKGFIRLPRFDNECSINGHLFYIITRSSKERRQLIQYFSDHGILAVFHYIPLHSSPVGEKIGRAMDNMNVTNYISERLLRLPLYFEMSDDDIDQVIGTLGKFYAKKR